MRKTLCFLIALLCSYTFYCQNKDKRNIYLNEVFQNIDKSTFKKKKKSYLYLERIKKTDSGKVHYLILSEEFGTLQDSTFENLKNKINQDYNLKLNQTLVIHYRDTLYSYKALKKYRNLHFVFRMVNGDTVNISTTPGLFLKNRIDFDDYQKKCKMESIRLNINHLHLYSTKFEDSHIYENMQWKKMNTYLKDKFFKYSSGVLIIKPNGQYYRFNETTEDWVKSVIEYKEWSILINDFETARRLSQKKRIKRFKYKQPTRARRKPIQITPDMTKKQIKKTFEQHSLNQPTTNSCYSSYY
ncbi:MAG: hypothetical protein Wins2KO_31500 [Winogradskyella sp.]